MCDWMTLLTAQHSTAQHSTAQHSTAQQADSALFTITICRCRKD